MPTMAKARKPKTAWQKRLKSLQERLALTNAEMAARLRIPKRTWLAWKYGQNTPRLTAVTLIELIEQGKL